MNPIKNNIIKELELDKLTPEEKEETIIKVGALIYQNVLMRVLENMPDKDQDEFEALLDKNAEAGEVFTFLQNKVPNFEQIVSEESLKFKSKASNIMSQIN